MLAATSYDQVSSHNPATHLIQTRDCRRFRPLASPLAALSNHFFTLLRAPGIEGSNLRSAYAWSVTGADPAGRPRSEIDAITLKVLQQPPTVLLLQGAMRVDHLLEPVDDQAPSSSTPGSATSDSFSVHSMTSSLSGLSAGSRPDLADCIILPYTLHQGLDEAIKDRDEEQKVKLSLMALSSIIHETAHWLGLRLHGFRMSNNFGKAKMDNALCLLGQRPDDLGAIAGMLLLGAQYKLLTYADGEQELVARSIETIENGGKLKRPLLSPAKLTHLLAGPAPRTRDVTTFRHVGTGDKPSWAKEDLSTIVSMLSNNSMCHHGSCVRVNH